MGNKPTYKELEQKVKKLEKASCDLKQVPKALRKEKDRAQKYFDVAGVMLVVVEADGTVSHINKKGCEILGYKETDIIGKDWFKNFLPKNLRSEVKGVFRELMAGEIKPVKYYENHILTKSGEERAISWHNTVLKDDKGKIIAALGSGG